MSQRRRELLDAAYAYVLEHGLADLSLRPLAAATTTSPRVLLYLFGSKDHLVREILAQARRDELALVATATAEATERGADRFEYLISQLWQWLTETPRQPAIRLFFEAYALSLRAVIAPDRTSTGPWDGFAEQSIQDWTEILIAAQPGVAHHEATVRATRTLGLLRGLLLQWLAGGDLDLLTEALLSPHLPDETDGDVVDIGRR
jgi:AcrR family transcriptional regulator